MSVTGTTDWNPFEESKMAPESQGPAAAPRLLPIPRRPKTGP